MSWLSNAVKPATHPADGLEGDALGAVTKYRYTAWTDPQLRVDRSVETNERLYGGDISPQEAQRQRMRRVASRVGKLTLFGVGAITESLLWVLPVATLGTWTVAKVVKGGTERTRARSRRARLDAYTEEQRIENRLKSEDPSRNPFAGRGAKVIHSTARRVEAHRDVRVVRRPDDWTVHTFNRYTPGAAYGQPGDFHTGTTRNPPPVADYAARGDNIDRDLHPAVIMARLSEERERELRRRLMEAAALRDEAKPAASPAPEPAPAPEPEHSAPSAPSSSTYTPRHGRPTATDRGHRPPMSGSYFWGDEDYSAPAPPPPSASSRPSTPTAPTEDNIVDAEVVGEYKNGEYFDYANKPSATAASLAIEPPQFNPGPEVGPENPGLPPIVPR